jgi:AraC family transcriptional regulator of adaptative response/methylated-DNA-[protein]-cysteine methyltransferase
MHATGTATGQAARDYGRVERAIRFIDARRHQQPTLGEVAAHLGLSRFHLQRLFTRWAGVSPKRFLQALTLAEARQRLRASRSVLDAALAVGLSGPGRLHDLLVVHEAVTPGDVRRRGAGLPIAFGFHPSPFGACLVAATDRGICYLGFVQEGDRGDVLNKLRRDWPRADLAERPEVTAPLAQAAFTAEPGADLRVHLRGSPFQLRVWEALLRVPEGALVTYGDVARAVGQPRAARAAGGAVGANPVSYLIPCHRVIRSTGAIGNYGGGPTRKRALLAHEAVQRPSQRAGL